MMRIKFICFAVLGLFFSIHAMTLEEKVGQVMMVHFYGEAANSESDRLIQDLHIGGIIYYKWANSLHSPAQVKQLSEQLQSLSKIPLLIAVDQEGGRVNRLTSGFQTFPSNRTVTDENQAYCTAYLTGKQLFAVGINMNLAPVVDVDSNPQNPVIGDRSFSPDPKIVARFGLAALNGCCDANVIPVLKHFPGHGDTTIDSHRGLPIVGKTINELQEVELYPFRKLAPFAPVIMTAHLVVPAFDPDRCATLSKKVITELLRKDMGFSGVVITDSLVMQGVLDCCEGSVEEASLHALNAGCDILLLGGRQLSGENPHDLSAEEISRIHKSLVEAVKNGSLSEERLDEAVQRILNLKNLSGLSCGK